MDLGEMLDVTVPVTFEFMDKRYTAHVFTAGGNRLTQAERERLAAASKPAEEANRRIKEIEAELVSANGNKGELEAERAALFRKANDIALAHGTLPVIVRSFEDDRGEVVQWHGEPITANNISKLPDEFLWSAFTKVVPVWQDPTGPVDGPNSQSAEERAEAQPEENMISSQTSD